MNTGWENEQLSAYVDGQLDAQEQAQIEQLLDESPEARRTVEQIRRLRRLMSDMPRIAVGEDIAGAAIAEAERQILSSSTKRSSDDQIVDKTESGESATKPSVKSDPTPASRSVFQRLLTRRGLAWACLVIGVAVTISLFDLASDRSFDPLAHVDDQEQAVNGLEESGEGLTATQPPTTQPVSDVAVSEPAGGSAPSAANRPVNESVGVDGREAASPELSAAPILEKSPDTAATAKSRFADQGALRNRANQAMKSENDRDSMQTRGGESAEEQYRKLSESRADSHAITPEAFDGSYDESNQTNEENTIRGAKMGRTAEMEREAITGDQPDSADGLNPYGISGIFPPMPGEASDVKKDDIDQNLGGSVQRYSGTARRSTPGSGEAAPRSVSDGSTLTGRATMPARAAMNNDAPETSPMDSPAEDMLPAMADTMAAPVVTEPQVQMEATPPSAGMSIPPASESEMPVEAAPTTPAAPTIETLEDNPYAIKPTEPSTPDVPAQANHQGVAPMINTPMDFAPTNGNTAGIPGPEPMLEQPAVAPPQVEPMTQRPGMAARPYGGGQAGGIANGAIQKPQVDSYPSTGTPAITMDPGMIAPAAEPAMPAEPALPSVVDEPVADDSPAEAPAAPSPSTITFGGAGAGPGGSTMQLAPNDSSGQSAAAEMLNRRLQLYRQEVAEDKSTGNMVIYFDSLNPETARRAIESIFKATGATNRMIEEKQVGQVDGAVPAKPVMYVVEISDQRLDTMLRMITARSELFEKITPAAPDQSQQELIKSKGATLLPSDPTSAGQDAQAPRQVLFVIRPFSP